MEQQPKPYKDYRWIIADPEWLGGKPCIRGTRLSVSLILECLSAGMDNESFGGCVPAEAISEVLKVGAELADKRQAILSPASSKSHCSG
jgi:uncharacterized protein (DUF433 family)